MRVYREARSVVCISEKVRDQFPENLRVKTRVIYNGVDSELFGAVPESSSRPTILSVGNLIPIKGHALLFRAFAKMRRTVPNVELEIIGEGPERGNLIQLAEKLGISSQVRFLGRVGRQAVARAMQSCAVFVLPSSYEGLGCVYLEAMSCGKPAIGCFGQGIEEVIDHDENGLLVPPGNEVALSNALLAVLQDANLRHRLGTAARDRILQRHTLERQAQQLAELYREVVA
jgi:glycosyltransferase involved in cell wall biosynthesis